MRSYVFTLCQNDLFGRRVINSEKYKMTGNYYLI